MKDYENQLVYDAYKYFGAHLEEGGVTFRVYAPNAVKLSVAGDFNQWNYKEYWLNRLDHGIFELHIPELSEWNLYKFAVFSDDTRYVEKSDPYASYNELRPSHASKIINTETYQFNDGQWMKSRSLNFDKPMNIYEMHLGSWLEGEETYESIAFKLIDYLNDMAYTHVEFMPITEYPFDGSWGYQVTGFFAVTSRYGSLEQFKYLVDLLHQNGIGVILDVVPVHFVKDIHGLARFDGTNLYEIEQDSEWGTCYFDYHKMSVQNFFISSLVYWLETCHIDGFRMDAVSHLIYHRGNRDFGINEAGLNFMKLMNATLKGLFPKVMLIAEDSSDYGYVTGPVDEGGLGFDYKWDLGWMNDTLKYYSLDPIYKKYDHHQLTFSMAYFYSEHFILPLSHDEVVHGKKTIIDKMWGSYENKFALTKNLYTYMMTHPGKKLNFMGNELAHFREWDEEKPLDWFLLDYPMHESFKLFIRDLQRIYKHHRSLYAWDYEHKGFKWIDADNNKQSVYIYLRQSARELVLVILNMTPNSYEDFLVGVPKRGKYMELINSERSLYGGCDMTNYDILKSVSDEKHGYEQSINVRIAPYAAIILKKV